MLKQIIFAAVLLAMTQAHAGEYKSVSCKMPREAHGFKSIELKADLILEDWMKHVTVTTVDENYKGEDVTTVGRTAQLESDRDYKPRKYKNHIRYQLRQLTDTSDFSRFYPGDQCAMELIVPEKADKLATFKAPLIIHCDQSGGTTTLLCETFDKK